MPAPPSTLRFCASTLLSLAATLSAVLTIVVVSGGLTAAVQLPQAPPVAPAATAPVDVSVVDPDGRSIEGLGPASFTVTVDGKPRRIAWVRHVNRGPGSTGEAARRQAGSTAIEKFGAEPARNVLIVIDELSIQRGAERTATQAATALVDRLGLDDRVGVLRVPIERGGRMSFTTDRPEVQAALRKIVGRASLAAHRPLDRPGAVQPPAAAADPDRAAAGDPDRVAAAERERAAMSLAEAPRILDESPGPAGLVATLLSVMESLKSTPGRKIVVLISAGMPASGLPLADDVVRSAIAAHAVVHGLWMPGAKDNPDNPLDGAAFERIALATGGTFSALGRNADKTADKAVERAAERAALEMGSCYVLGLETLPSDRDGRRHAIRVDVARPSVTVHAPAWLMPVADAPDVIPPAEVPPGGLAAPDALVRGPASPATDKARAAAARQLELQRLLAKAIEYVTGYQREYSMLVAEEQYVQNSAGAKRELRSDLLLVRPQAAEGWLGFRDVFEVDGRSVRDRDDRLRRLFLDGSQEARAQLGLIKQESSRYNIGRVERNINMPLFALEFLGAGNVARSAFSLSGSKSTGGVTGTQVTFSETGRPTLVRQDQKDDLPAEGWFVIDPASGAVMSTRLLFRFQGDGSVFAVTVRYARDPNLGLWVPAEMTEVVIPNSLTSRVGQVAFEGVATYSRFRRFQVQTEAEIKIKK